MSNIVQYEGHLATKNYNNSYIESTSEKVNYTAILAITILIKF